MSKKIVYNKLVRDRIPEIIEAEGKTVYSRILSKQDYLTELIKKLGEEYAEFKADQNAEERADLQEVILALADALDISHSELAKTLSEKALKRGAFKKRIFLESVEEWATHGKKQSTLTTDQPKAWQSICEVLVREQKPSILRSGWQATQAVLVFWKLVVGMVATPKQ